MFLITSITMLRERTTGTLERLMTMPLSKLDLLVGYGIAFALLAGLQAAVTTGFAYLVLDLTTAGSAFWVALLAIANGVLGMSAWAVGQRVRPNRVPGGAIHARLHPAPRSCSAGYWCRAARFRIG